MNTPLTERTRQYSMRLLPIGVALFVLYTMLYVVARRELVLVRHDRVSAELSGQFVHKVTIQPGHHQAETSDARVRGTLGPHCEILFSPLIRLETSVREQLMNRKQALGEECAISDFDAQFQDVKSLLQKPPTQISDDQAEPRLGPPVPLEMAQDILEDTFETPVRR